MTSAIRTVSETEDVHTIEGFLSFGTRDTYGTFFSARTDWGFDLHPAGIPVLFNHGFDPDFGLRPIGMTGPTSSFRSEEDGIWVQMQLDKRNKYYESRIKPLLEENGLGISQGSAEHSVQIDARSGEVMAWPTHEMSLTPTNSNWFNVVAARAGDVLRIIANRADMSTADINDLPDSDFAYIEPGGDKDDGGKTTPRSKRHFPIHDAAHVRNALSRAPQSPFGEKAMPKIRAAAKKFGVDVADDSARTGVRSASSDAATAASILQSLFYLMGCESDEADQLAMLQRAADAIQEFVTAECAEIGTDDDDEMGGAYMSGVRAGARHSAADQARVNAMHDSAMTMHDHAVALGATNHEDGDSGHTDGGDGGDDDAARSGERPTPTLRIRERPNPDAVRADLLDLARTIGLEAAKTV